MKKFGIVFITSMILAGFMTGCTSAGGTTDSKPGPTVLSTYPVNEAIGISLNTTITAHFDNPMEKVSINADTFTLKDSNQTAVSGTVIVADDGLSAVFTPAMALLATNTYCASVTAGVKAQTGQAMNSDVTWIFTTRLFSGLGPDPVMLGLAGNYAILAESGISTIPTSAIKGNIGISPMAATYITGFSLTLPAAGAASTSPQVTGFVYAPGYAAPTPANLTTAISNKKTAYDDAAGRLLPDFLNLYAGNLSGKSLAPGLYKWGSSVVINENLILAGNENDIWIFQISGDITMAANKSIIINGSGVAKNIFWQVAGGTGVTVGAGSHFEGIVMTATEINMGTGSSANGRLLAHTAVNIHSSTITEPAK